MILAFCVKNTHSQSENILICIEKTYLVYKGLYDKSSADFTFSKKVNSRKLVKQKWLKQELIHAKNIAMLNYACILYYKHVI